MLLQLFLLVLRSLQLFCRLVLSLQPIPLKLPPAKVLALPVAKDTVVYLNSSRAAVKRAEDSALESPNCVGNACILNIKICSTHFIDENRHFSCL